MKLLVDVCCGICLLGVLPQIQDMDYYLIFSGDNICCEEEFDRRKDVFLKVCSYYNIHNYLTFSYYHKGYLEYVKGFENEKERGKRCQLCFEYRFNKLLNNLTNFKFNENFVDNKIFNKSYENNDDEIMFTTTLSVSRYKNYNQILLAGNTVANRFNNKIKFLSKNFKNDQLYAKGYRIAKDLGLYRQKFCGCEFSKRQ